MRSLRVNLGASTRGLAHAGGSAAPGAGALTVRARRPGGAFSADASAESAARSRTRAEVLVGGGATAVVVAAAFALAARSAAAAPSAAARLAACAMRARRLDDCLGMSETRIARRGGDEDSSETGQTQTTRKDARATDRGGDDASTRRARRRGRSRATRVARRGVASRRDADARNREGQLVPPSRAVDTRDKDDRTRPHARIES